MIRSMTGFGRGICSVAGVSFPLEVRSVNHRHLDLQVRLPRPLAACEPALRARVRQRLRRGKVDVLVGAPSTALPARLEVDAQAARAYVEAARELAADHGVSVDLGAAELLELPGVARFVEAELPEGDLERELLGAADAALDALCRMRAAEGAALSRELGQRLAGIGGLLDAVGVRAAEVQQGARERLRKRARELGEETGLLDEARLHQEIVIAADRLDVTEELVRLRSHVEQFVGVLSSAAADEPVGRRLEFLLQEMVREANTLGSKAGDAPVAHCVVDLKTELERMREQVLNLE